MDVSLKLNTEALPAAAVEGIIKTKGESELALKKADHEFQLAMMGQINAFVVPMALGFQASQQARVEYAKGANLEAEIRLVEARTRLAEVELRSEELRAKTAEAEVEAVRAAEEALYTAGIRPVEDEIDAVVDETDESNAVAVAEAIRRHLDSGNYRTVTGVFNRE